MEVSKTADISVIIPTWNRKDLLERAIGSVLDQTLRPLEVLVCDDGSTDGSRELVDSMDDARVRWLAGEHTGRPAVPRNRGIYASRGKWLAFLDSDDEWLPDKLERQMSLVGKTGCDTACSNAQRNSPSGGVTGDLLDGIDTGTITFSRLLHVNYVIGSSVLTKRALVERCGGFPEDPDLLAAEDYALWLRMATFTDFTFLNEPLVVYRDEPEDSIRTNGPPEWEQRINVLDSFMAWAEEKDPDGKGEFIRKAKRALLYAKMMNGISRTVSYFKLGGSR